MAFKSAKIYSKMSDEIEGLDDELKSVCTDVKRDLAALEQTQQSLTSDQATKIFLAVKGKMDRAKTVYQSFKNELRELNHDQLAEYEPKLKDHARCIDELSRRITSERERITALKQASADKSELFGSKALEKKHADESGDRKTAGHMIKEAEQLQSQDLAATQRMQQMVEDSERVGVETTVKMKAQTEQLGSIKSDVDKVQANMGAANKLLNHIGRALMTDKILLCLVLLLVLGILTIIVLKILGVDLRGGGQPGPYVIDCSFEWAKQTKECQNLGADSTSP